jgi:hypothetical protein
MALLPAFLTAAAFAARPAEEPVAPPHPPVAAADWQPRAGDVVLRASDDPVGAGIRSASGGGAVYSHVGLVVARAGGAEIVDISPYGSGRVGFTDLGAFTTDGDTIDLLVLRPRTPIDAARLTAEAERLAGGKVEFDYRFDMADGAKLYCAELAFRLLAEAGFDVGSIPWTQMHVPLHGERRLVTPDAFAHSAGLVPVFRRKGARSLSSAPPAGV